MNLEKIQQRAGRAVDWLDEHSKGLKTIAGLAVMAYGYKTGNSKLIDLGLFLSGIGTGDKLRKMRQGASIMRVMDIPVARKIAQRIPFRK